MKRPRLTKHMFGYSVIATLLALCSLPTLPSHAHVLQHHPQMWPNRHRAVPTMAGTPAPSIVAPDGAAVTPTPTHPQPRYQLGRLRVHVIDGRTLQPLHGAEVVLIETEQRLTTNANGYTDWLSAPIIRSPRYRPMIAELHGQLGVIAYKNGYRDSVHLGIRIHDDAPAETTVWMYEIGPGDRRIEPVLYEEPYHHLWLIDLADKFRSKTQIGEGPQRP